MRNYLTFDNKDSRDFGVYINGQGTFRAPARSYNVLNIPGRNGDLLGFGSKLENVEITYRAFIYTNFDANIAALRSFLLSHVGYFKLTDSYHPDEYRLAYYKGPFVPDVVANNGAGSFDLTFVCKPQRFLNSGEEVTTLTPAGAEQHTYQGEIVNFSTLAGDKITSARADFHPIQDLHGYSHPWPAGGGKQLLNPSMFEVSQSEHGVTASLNPDGSITLNGTATANTYFSVIPYTALSAYGLEPNVSYTLSGYTSNSVYAMLGVYGSGTDYRASTDAGVVMTFTENQIASLRYRMVIYIANGTHVDGFVVKPMICKTASSEPTVFAPYSNICPISGRTGLTVYRTRKNLLDDAIKSFGDGGFVFFNAEGDRYHKTTTLQAGTYTFSVTYSQAFETTKAHLRVYDVGTDTRLAGVYNGTKVSFTLTQITDIALFVQNSGLTVSDILTAQLELGSTATTYESYNGNTYAVDWTSEAGTVYGGTPDVVTGVLTVDMAMKDLGTMSWNKVSTAGSHWRFWAYLNDMANGGEMLSSQYKHITASQSYIGEIGIASQAAGNNYLVMVTDERFSDAATFKTAMNGVQLVYELATPLTYQLTPQEIEALADNYMWSDVGQVTVTVTDAMTIENPTLFDAKPLLRVYGAGTLTLGGQTITISTADVYTDIDCEMMDCFKDTVSKNGNVSFSGYDFPVIPPGRNVITMDGVTQVDITPRWWAA